MRRPRHEPRTKAIFGSASTAPFQDFAGTALEGHSILNRPAVGLVLSLTVQAIVLGGSPVYVGSQRSDPLSIQQIDHSAWDQLLGKYVNAAGRVDYRAWKSNRGDVRRLDDYLGHLSAARRQREASRESRLAFWINAYNAVTIRGILREYPTTSIRNHTAKIWGYNIWKDLKLYVGGAPVSLDQMEHEILRKMSEPRIHFAIVCASIGCPRLASEAYWADKIESQLESQAREFFAQRRNFRYDVSGRRFYLSAILNWFGEDFGSDRAARLRRISRWLPTAAARQAAAGNSVSVSYLDYDWNLNEQSRK